MEVGRDLELQEEELNDLRYGAIFHDIGKIAIPDAILNKAGPLTDAELDQIKTHPIVGEQILAPVPLGSSATAAVRPGAYGGWVRETVQPGAYLSGG